MGRSPIRSRSLADRLADALLVMALVFAAMFGQGVMPGQADGRLTFVLCGSDGLYEIALDPANPGKSAPHATDGRCDWAMAQAGPAVVVVADVALEPPFGPAEALLPATFDSRTDRALPRLTARGPPLLA